MIKTIFPFTSPARSVLLGRWSHSVPLAGAVGAGARDATVCVNACTNAVYCVWIVINKYRRPPPHTLVGRGALAQGALASGEFGRGRVPIGRQRRVTRRRCARSRPPRPERGPASREPPCRTAFIKRSSSYYYWTAAINVLLIARPRQATTMVIKRWTEEDRTPHRRRLSTTYDGTAWETRGHGAVGGGDARENGSTDEFRYYFCSRIDVYRRKERLKETRK